MGTPGFVACWSEVEGIRDPEGRLAPDVSVVGGRDLHLRRLCWHRGGALELSCHAGPPLVAEWASLPFSMLLYESAWHFSLPGVGPELRD